METIPHDEKKIPYRADIDGLRGIAVIVVILFHARIFGFSGGFIGVDVFFVISGYLIASIILSRLNEGTFSLITFIANRMRRILPAMIVVLLSISAVAFFLLTYPGDLFEYGRSLLSQSFFASNMFFMFRDTYFGVQQGMYPLLHTWSLAIEEQFYIILPPLLLLLFTVVRKRISALIFILSGASLAFSIYLVNIAPFENIFGGWVRLSAYGVDNVGTGFFFLFSRAWELLAGVLLATTAYTMRTKRTAEIAGLVGGALIVVSVIYITDTTPFPGVLALFPVIGALLIISSGVQERTLVGKALAWKPLVYVGLISYPLYLWHWPLLTFAYMYQPVLTWWQIVALIALTAVLSHLTYVFIEKPIRTKKILRHSLAVIASGIASLAFVAVIGVAFIHFDKTHDRVPKDIRERELVYNPFSEYETCMTSEGAGVRTNNEPCLIGYRGEDVEPSIVLWGDSHAVSIAPMIDAMARERKIKVAFFVSNACPPLPYVEVVPRRAACVESTMSAYQYIQVHKISTVILSANWSVHVGTQGDQSNGTLQLTEELPVPVETLSEVLETSLREFVRTLALEKQKLYIVSQVPQQDYFSLREVFYSSKGSSFSFLPKAITYEKHQADSQTSALPFENIKELGNVIIIDPADILCRDAGVCINKKEETLLYRDYSHLNEHGAFLIQPLFNKVFEDK